MSFSSPSPARGLTPTSSPRGLLARTGVGAGLLVGAIAVGGCSVKGGDNANVIVGKQAFVARCGSCHILARAGTKGNVGPNLDDAFHASVAEGLGRGSLRGVVEGQIRLPNPTGAMPANLVSGSTLKDVAAYVAQVASASGKDSGLLASAVEAPGAGKPAVETGGKLSIPASPSGQLAYTTSKATATVGAVTIEMPNSSGVSHNIAIEAGSGGATGSGAALGASQFTVKSTASVSVSLKPGIYTFFCQAPGHRGAGMFGVITVK